MRASGVLAVAFAWCMSFTTYSAPDLVSEPLRKYGLGDLLLVALSPDGQWMATAGSSGAFIWSFTNGTVLHRLEGHHSRITTLRFSPDDHVLLTGGLDSMVRAWDVETGQELRSFAVPFGEIIDLAFAPDGQSFACTARDAARVWSLSRGELLHTLTAPGQFTHALFTPDGNRLVTGVLSETNENIRLWDLASEETIRQFDHRHVTALAFTTAGQLVTASQNDLVQIWDIETGQTNRSLLGGKLITSLVASTNSSIVIAGCHIGEIIGWDASTGEVRHNFVSEPHFAMAAIPGTNHLLIAHRDNLVRVKSIQTGHTLRVFAGHTTSTTLGVGFSRDGQQVVSGGLEVFTRLWNRTNAQQVGMLPGHGSGTAAASFSPDGSHVLTTFGAPPIFSARLWNAVTGQLEREFIGHSDYLLAAAFSPDGQRIVTGAADGTARLWNATTATQVRVFNSPGTWVAAVAVSSNGTFLASGSSDGVARLWNTSNGELLRSFVFEFAPVSALAFSPATGHLLVAWQDGILLLYDPATGELTWSPISASGFLESATFSPDGRFILTGEGGPFTARLWDARNGQELRIFAGHAGPVDSVAFNASGTSILTGSDIVRLWSIADIAARLESGRKPEGLELRWHVGTLQRATDVKGPWQDLTEARSPWLISTDQSLEIFRVKVLD